MHIKYFYFYFYFIIFLKKLLTNKKMKKLTLFALAAFLLSNCQAFDTNILDGPNNIVLYGLDNSLHGRDNVVGGYRN